MVSGELFQEQEVALEGLVALLLEERKVALEGEEEEEVEAVHGECIVGLQEEVALEGEVAL